MSFYFSMYGLARFQSVTGRMKGMALSKTFLQQPSFQLFWGKVLLKIGVEICYDFAVFPALGQLSSYSAESWNTIKTIGYRTERKKNCKHKYPTKNNQLYFLFGFVERHNFLQGRIFQLSDIRASTAMRDIRLIDRVKTTTIDRAERHTRLKYIWTVLVPFIVASRWSLFKSHGLKDRWKNRWKLGNQGEKIEVGQERFTVYLNQSLRQNNKASPSTKYFIYLFLTLTFSPSCSPCLNFTKM